MVKKIYKSADEAVRSGGAHLAGQVRESASQIWLAGLGAFAKAQEEGSKVFDTLVKEGVAMQRKSQATAEEKFSEATSRMASMASDISSRASGSWDKLESIFEERVSRALARLGVPSSKDLAALAVRIDELQRTVDRLNTKASVTRAPRAAAGAGTAAKATPRKRVARKTA